MITHRWLPIVLGLLGASLGAQPTSIRPLTPKQAKETPAVAPSVVAPAPARGVHDRAELEAFLDGVMAANLRDKHVAGATVSVVKDGALLFAKGYGYADVAKRAPVDGDRTLFRIGSTSKLFTWTAVMQLVEQGKLDLDADVNRYIDFKIPATFPQPITLRHIMTHTPGFEEDGRDLISDDSTVKIDLGKLLASHIPGRVRPPGTFSSYSNYATALAGYVVQRVSGVPWDDYIGQHVLAPLGMTHTSTRQPLPAALHGDMSQGYVWGGGSYIPKKFEIVGPAPAGSLSSPGEDMAHFMIAHLQNGEYNGNRILKEETAKLMHDSPLTLLPPLDRMELGFFETNINGREVIAHLGDSQNFHTSLHLFLKENTGFYVSFNAAGKEGAAHHLRLALFADFADRYFPGPPLTTARVDDATAKQHAQMLAGNWRASRGAFTTFLSAIGLIGQTKVSVGAKGELVIGDAKGLNGQLVKWVEIAPFVWHDANGHDSLAAKVVDGKVERFSYGLGAPFEVWLRVDGKQDGAWLVPALCVSLAALFLTVVFWPVNAIVRRRFRTRLDLPAPALRAYRAGKLGALLVFSAFIAWTLSVGKLQGNRREARAA